mmetsp:Transcript_23184/g.26435  ORF Transcript_23184/g.26435 Transcript_23184/m.26435 type:complete len:137 (+) Transcript_23184:238-648(+)
MDRDGTSEANGRSIGIIDTVGNIEGVNNSAVPKEGRELSLEFTLSLNLKEGVFYPLVDNNGSNSEELGDLVVSNLVGTSVGISDIEGISCDEGRSLGSINWDGFMDRDSTVEVDGKSVGKHDVLVNAEGLKISAES